MLSMRSADGSPRQLVANVGESAVEHANAEFIVLHKHGSSGHQRRIGNRPRRRTLPGTEV